MHRTFALDPWTLGVRLKRRRSGSTITPTPHGAEPQHVPPTGGVESKAKAALHRVWPYPWAGWVPFAVARGIAVARRERPVAVLSSFPPTASHVAALALHRATGVPWIADFRDPWTWRDRHGYNWSADRRGAAATERAVLRHASALTTIGPSLGAELAEHAGREVVVLPHGIPVEPVDAAPRHARFERLELVHAGTANEPFANLTPIVRALLRLHEQEMPGAADAVRAGRIPPAASSTAPRRSGSWRRRATSRARRPSAPPPPRTSPCSCASTRRRSG